MTSGTPAGAAVAAGAGERVLRAPSAFAAAFAIQGTSVPYPQVSNAYLPFFGYYPLRRGPGSRCCAATPPWPCSWLPSCCAQGRIRRSWQPR